MRQFDLVTANPMWNQDFPISTYEHDPHDRFCFGSPPASSADWGWLQHMLASLKDGGRMAVVLDTGAVSRGSGNQGSNRERDIRRAFVEADLIEAVILTCAAERGTRRPYRTCPGRGWLRSAFPSPPSPSSGQLQALCEP